MDVLQLFETEEEALKIEKIPDISALLNYDEGIILKYESLSEDDRKSTDKYINKLVEKRNIPKNIQHMGRNFELLLKQLENTDSRLDLDIFAEFLSFYSHNIYNEPHLESVETLKRKLSDIFKKKSELKSAYARRTKNAQTVLSELKKLNQKEKSVSFNLASAQHREEEMYETLPPILDNYIFNISHTRTFRPYFRTDVSRFPEMPEDNDASDLKYVFMEVLCLYLGIDLNYIIHGTGKRYNIVEFDDPDTDLLIDTWIEEASNTVDKELELYNSWELDKDYVMDHFPIVDFGKVYHAAYDKDISYLYVTSIYSYQIHFLEKEDKNSIVDYINLLCN